ncbi:MAG TPA: sodium:solute symporter, partial [Cyclobacteriaceae bacterium]
AILSTTSSALLAPSAIVSENIVKPIMKGKLSDRGLVWWTRVAIVVIGTASTAMACMKSNIYELVAESSIMSLVSLFVPMAAGMYWRKATPFGAFLSMIAGIVVWAWFEWNPISVPSLIPGLAASTLAMLVGSAVFNRRIANFVDDENRTAKA